MYNHNCSLMSDCYILLAKLRLCILSLERHFSQETTWVAFNVRYKLEIMKTVVDSFQKCLGHLKKASQDSCLSLAQMFKLKTSWREILLF